MARKKNIKKSEDFNELMNLAKQETVTKKYTTNNDKIYEVTFDKVFSIGKIKEAFNDYFVISALVNKFEGNKNYFNTNLMFCILIQKFTDKNFIETTDIMEKFNTYVRVGQALNQIELVNGVTLLEQIIADMGEENLKKVSEYSQGYAETLVNNKDFIINSFNKDMNVNEEVQES